MTAEPAPSPAPASPAHPPAGRPPALVASCVFGVIAGLLLIVGDILSSEPVLVFCALAGTGSLTAALVWRSQLIDAWRAEHKRPPARL